MIVVDSSAIVAIFLRDPEAPEIADRLFADADALISVVTLVETSMVIVGKQVGSPASADSWLDQFLAEAEITVVPATVDQATLARLAFRQYGKGMGHPAQLNFGDCFAYALAKSLDIPLLYKGDDFSKTDIAPAL